VLDQVHGEVPHARLAHAAADVGDIIYVIGGRYDNNDVNGNFELLLLCISHLPPRGLDLQHQDAHLAPRDYFGR